MHISDPQFTLSANLKILKLYILLYNALKFSNIKNNLNDLANLNQYNKIYFLLRGKKTRCNSILEYKSISIRKMLIQY